MKLMVGDIVYLQRYEVSHLINEKHHYNRNIMQEIFETNQKLPQSTGSDGYIFDYSFQNVSNTTWLMAQDWILDYREYRKLSVPDLKLLTWGLKKNLDQAVNDFNAKPKEYRDKCYKEESIRFMNEHYKIHSLVIMEKFLQGEIQFLFPKNIIPYIN